MLPRAMAARECAWKEKGYAPTPQKGIHQPFHALDGGQRAGGVRGRVHLRVQAQRGQRRFELMGKIHNQLFGFARFGSRVFLALVQPRGQLGDRVFQLGERVVAHAHGQGLPRAQRCFDLRHKGAQTPPVVQRLPQASGQREGQRNAHGDHGSSTQR